MTTLNLQVGTSADDAHQRTSGAMSTTDQQLYFGDTGPYQYHGGMRFIGVSGLSGATIDTATLGFRAQTSESGDFVGTFYAQDAAAPGTFTTAANNISDTAQRPRTTALCGADGADFGAWTADQDYTYTGDGVNTIAETIQELADSYDPSTIVLLWIYTSGNGKRRSASYDFSPSLAPKLDIDYTAGGEDVTVTPPTATLTTSTFAPVIKLVVIPGKRTLSLATFTPVLGLSVIPPPLALSLTAFVPTVTATGDVTVTPSTVALSLAVFAPIIKIVVTPPTLAFNLQAFAPTISTPRLVTPSTAVLSLAAFAPTVSAPRLVTPGMVSLSISVFAPTVTATGNVVVTPGVLTLSLGLFAPTVSTPRVVTPGLVALSLTTFIPTIMVAAAFMAIWLDSGSVALLLVLDGSVSLPQAVNDGTISIKETEDATV